ncbi:response regulator transcription factor [Wolinella succinogenes]|uniref:response regulator transcription factor n=1 Tax=Wolinella succinogenes TaxID=844 RepID=UPI002FCBD5BE
METRVLQKLSSIRVLVVEDDGLTLEAITQSLMFYCKEVLGAKNGLEGFEIFEKSEVDVVITDINLPQMSGLEMISAIIQIAPHTPFIVMTSYDTSENILYSLDRGVCHYLRKPLRIEDLQTALLMATRNLQDARLELAQGFVYDKNLKELFFKGERVILTRAEKRLFHLLASNAPRVIGFETIEGYVWQEKSMSLEALRMCVKKIRGKTYSEIIESVSGCGYRMKVERG